jgi:hypothetical protein
MGIGGMKLAQGAEWHAALQAAMQNEFTPCPECGQLLTIRRDNAIGEKEPIAISVSCSSSTSVAKPDA